MIEKLKQKIAALWAVVKHPFNVLKKLALFVVDESITLLSLIRNFLA
jgi:hypothetical protein